MILCTCRITSAQITFQKTFGGTGSDKVQSVQQTADGGYIIAGSTNSFGAGGYDVYLIKTTANGDTLWTKTFGGAFDDFGFSVQQTADGGYIIAGSTNSFVAGFWEVYLIKTTANGDTIWTKTFGGIEYEWGYSVQQTTDGGYIIAGFTGNVAGGGSDVYLIKTTANGDTIWTKTFGGIENDIGNSVQQTTDGGYIIAGLTGNVVAGGSDVYLIKTTTNGDTIWTKKYGGTNNDDGFSVQQTTDSGYIIAGSTNSYGAGNGDVYLIKTTANGNILWTKTFGGIGNGVGAGDDWSYSVQQTSDGGYIIAGRTDSFSANYGDVYLIKATANGDTSWTKTYGGLYGEWGYSVQQTSDGGYIIAGMTSSFGAGSWDVYLIKTDTNGNSGCNQRNPATITGNTATQQTTPTTIIHSPATIVLNTATMTGSGGIITNPCTAGISELSPGSENNNIYPNPATDKLSIETMQKANIEIINIQGQLVKTLQTTEDKTSVDVSDLQAGMYIIKFNTAEGSVVRKFIKE